MFEVIMALNIYIKVFRVEMNQVQKAIFEGRELHRISIYLNQKSHSLISIPLPWSSYPFQGVQFLLACAGVFSYHL
jgi:hypothetical protein